jgi:hypothetical protein
MAFIHDQVSAQFRAFEQRGRGWQVFSEPVAPEPAFRPFLGYTLPLAPDDGRRPTVLSSMVAGLSRWLGGTPEAGELPPDPEEPEPEYETRGRVVELQTALPAKLDISREAFGSFLDRLGACCEPITFELVGTKENILAQFVASEPDVPLLRRQLGAYFPEVAFLPGENFLQNEWGNAAPESLVVEFGLEKEFLLPLASDGKLDPFLSLISALSELSTGECAVFQVIFQPTRHDWRGSAWRALADDEAKAIFANAPRLLIGAKEKFTSTLYAVVVRVAVKAESFDRTTEIAREMAYALRVFALPEGNALVPLHNQEYPIDEHERDVPLRQSRRSGMLVTTEELTGFVHFPGPEVRSPKLRRAVERTKAAPGSVTANGPFLLGTNKHQGKSVTVCLTPDQRVRHTHLIGASGTGKSTLLFNLIKCDIDFGNGLAVFDPHGDLIERILGVIPPHRIQDVVLVDPSDEEYSVGFNILSAHSDLEKNLLASDLVSVFQRLSTSWGDQMGSVLQNAILAFLESSQGGTLADLQRFLIDAGFRNAFLKSVHDPNVVFYWQKAFPQLGSGKSIGPVLTRLEKLLSLKPIRYMVSQKENRLDFAHILDSGKIFLAKLSQGQIGKENSYLLGSLLVAKFQQMAMGRQRMNASLRRDYFLYLDEAHHFMTPSMAEILAGARKYRVGLVFAHQDLQQLQRDPDVAGAVLSNCYTRVVFRVGDADAKKLAEGFAYFESQDLQNLGTGEAIARIERSDGDFNLKVPPSDEPAPNAAATIREQVITASREKYATARRSIETELVAQFVEPEQPKKEAKPAGKPVATPLPHSLKLENPAPTLISKSIPTELPLPVSPAADPLPSATQIERPEIAPPHSVTVPEPKQPPQDKGIGGNQHNLIRERIELVARQLGYTPSREDKTGKQQKIDVVLEKANRSIACEIAITTTIDHEVGNVAKCLKAGFKQIAVISPSTDRLEKIESSVRACVSAGEAARVVYYQPDEFIAHLQELSIQDAVVPSTPNPSEGKFGKYKIKRSAATLTQKELEAREAAGLAMLAEAMRQKK